MRDGAYYFFYLSSLFLRMTHQPATFRRSATGESNDWCARSRTSESKIKQNSLLLTTQRSFTLRLSDRSCHLSPFAIHSLCFQSALRSHRPYMNWICVSRRARSRTRSIPNRFLWKYLGIIYAHMSIFWGLDVIYIQNLVICVYSRRIRN